MSALRLGTASLLLLGVGTAVAASEPLGPDAFATGRTIESASDEPLQTLLLDLPVYRGSVEPGLADLRVFNAAGEAVPHAVRALGAATQAPAERTPVPVFRLPAARSDDGGDLSRMFGVEIDLSDAGAVVRVVPTAGEPPPASGAVLIDLTGLERRVEALELSLAAEPAEFLAPVRLEASDDLTRFTPLHTRSVLARLEQDGHRIERSDVEFDPMRRRYVLLAAREGPLPVEIVAARARLAPRSQPPARHRTRVDGEPVADAPGSFVFDLGGAVPVDRVQVALPQPNTVVQAELSTAASADGPWTRHFSGLLYHLEGTPALRSAEVAVPARRARWHKLVVDPRGGGLGSGVPALEASWLPEQLLFVRRGAAPFSLAYGRVDAPAAHFSADGLIRSADVEPSEVPRETAALGPPRQTADPSVLEPAKPTVSARTLALWGVLVLAVVAVLALSLRLLRQER